MTNSFLPQGYTQPKSSGNYMKIEDGENRFRILSSPILGWLDWSPEKKPVRLPMDKKPAKPMVEGNKVKHFWAFVVWNVKEEKVQILEITQASIQGAIQALNLDADWGNPVGQYDIKITKKGQKLDTEYTITPVPKSPVSDKVKQAFKDANINLSALFEGGDPFANSKPSASEPVKEEPKSIATDDLPF